MEIWGWAVFAVLAAAVVVLAAKIVCIQRSADEIRAAFTERVAEETNTLIDTSCRDRHMRSLAGELNGELRKLRDERRRFQQGDSELKQAVTNISHDLRTPLTAISGYLELLSGEEKSARAEQYISIIQDRTEALKALTEELFSFSVISSTSDETRPERLSINGVLEESVAAFYAAFTKKGITPVISLPERPIYRDLDREALRRIYGNLLSNALKYSDGDLSITMEENGKTCFSNRASSLDAVSAQRLFDRFYTVESARSSTGIGLSIAKQLTERMGGKIGASFEGGVLSITLCF